MLDEDKIKQFKHYHHTVKRLLTLLTLNKAWSDVQKTDIDDAEVDHDSKGLIKRIVKSNVADVIRFGMDSVKSIIQSTGFDIGKATSQNILIEGGRLLKRSNDDLLDYIVKYLRKNKSIIRLYPDEIHFAYRSEESLQQDAILVRNFSRSSAERTVCRGEA